MRITIPLGRIRGIPIGAHWSVLVILALVADMLATSILPATVKHESTASYWTVGLLVAVAFLLSLMAHEVAHAVVARRSGVKVNSITLWMLGGVTALDGEPPDARSDLRIALVGPAVSGVCAVLAAAAALAMNVLGAPSVFAGGFLWLSFTNVLLAVFNLLPGAPLDGGRVVRALIWRRTGDRDRAELLATRGGRATGIVLIWLGVAEAVATANLFSGLWLMLIGWFLFSAAGAEWQATVTGHALDGLTVRDVMQPSFTYLPSYLAVAPAARRAVDADEDYFPVCDLDGHPVGIVGTDRLVQAVEEQRLAQTVIDVSAVLRPSMIAAPDEPLVAALRRAGSLGLLAVFDEGVLVGLVTPLVIRRALRRGVLRTDAAALARQ